MKSIRSERFIVTLSAQRTLMKQKRIIGRSSPPMRAPISRYSNRGRESRLKKKNKIKKSSTLSWTFDEAVCTSHAPPCGWEHPSTETSHRADAFPPRPVTLFAPDDYYLGTRKFMDLLIVLRTQRRSYREYRVQCGVSHTTKKR